MATQEGSRKRLKISRNELREMPSVTASTPPASSTLNNCPPTTEPAKAAHSAESPTSTCHHEQSLKTLRTDIDAMRQLVTCKICDRLLYEPYSLACGHTYCYSCLSQWLVSNRKKTCPDCRHVITQMPTPSYVIRELVLVFAARNELLPAGETSEEHLKWAKEEGEIVVKDKTNTDRRTGGLFRGCFAPGRQAMLFPIHDPGDGVDRCPQCHWEVEDGFCNHCGVHVDGREHLGFSDYEDSDDSDDDLDHELDLEDAEAVFGADGQDDLAAYGHDVFNLDPPVADRDGVQHAHGLFRGHIAAGSRHRLRPFSPETLTSFDDSEEDDEEEEEDEDARDSELEDFVVRDSHITYETENSDDFDSDVTEGRTIPSAGRVRRRAPIVIDDDDEDDDRETAHSTRAVDDSDQDSEDDDRETAPSARAVDDSDQDSEDEGPVARGSQRSRRPQIPTRQRGMPRVFSDDESSEGATDYESFTSEEDLDRESLTEDHEESSHLDSDVNTDYDGDDVADLESENTNLPYYSYPDHNFPGGGFDGEEDGFTETSEDYTSVRHHTLNTRNTLPQHILPRGADNFRIPTSRHQECHRAPFSASSCPRDVSAVDADGQPSITQRYSSLLSTAERFSPSADVPRSRPARSGSSNPSHPFQLATTLARINARQSGGSR